MFSRRLIALVSTLVAIGVNAACAPLATPTTSPVVLPSATVPPTIVVSSTAVASPTPTDCPTAWSWAYGPGSTEFDAALSQNLSDAGLTVRSVTSSTFGEDNLCNGLFHAMSLDVTIEFAVADASRVEAFTEVTAQVMSQIAEALPVSGIPNIGRVDVHFVAPEATWRCVGLGADIDCQMAP